MAQFQTTNTFDQNGHIFRALEPSDLQQFIDLASVKYSELRCATVIPLESIDLTGIEVVNIDAIRQLLDNATRPRRTGDNFDVIRSDFGEVVSMLALEDQFNTGWCWIGVRDRERSDMPARGIDLVGVENAGQLSVVLCEAKVSNEDGPVPQVVDSANDSLSKRLKRHINEHSTTSSRLWEAVRRTKTSEQLTLMAKAAFFWDHKRWDSLTVICCAIMIRPTSKYHENNFGGLRQNPMNLTPGIIRFIIVCLDGELDALVNTFNSSD